LEELLASNQQASIVRSLPGMGTVFAAEFLAEVGEMSRFSTPPTIFLRLPLGSHTSAEGIGLSQLPTEA
jgi:transposase IS116/IS110/IS902 family protein